MSILKYNHKDFTPTTFNDVLDKFFNGSIQRAGIDSFTPKVDIIENEKAFELHVEVPGMKKEDFNIEINDNYLTVSGERKFSTEKNEKDFYSIETRYGNFSRSFTLPENIDSAKINAKYNNGILELTIPKDEKKQLKTTIKVI